MSRFNRGKQTPTTTVKTTPDLTYIGVSVQDAEKEDHAMFNFLALKTFIPYQFGTICHSIAHDIISNEYSSFVKEGEHNKAVEKLLHDKGIEVFDEIQKKMSNFVGGKRGFTFDQIFYDWYKDNHAGLRGAHVEQTLDRFEAVTGLKLTTNETQRLKLYNFLTVFNYIEYKYLNEKPTDMKKIGAQLQQDDANITFDVMEVFPGQLYPMSSHNLSAEKVIHGSNKLSALVHSEKTTADDIIITTPHATYDPTFMELQNSNYDIDSDDDTTGGVDKDNTDRIIQKRLKARNNKTQDNAMRAMNEEMDIIKRDILMNTTKEEEDVITAAPTAAPTDAPTGGAKSSSAASTSSASSAASGGAAAAAIAGGSFKPINCYSVSLIDNSSVHPDFYKYILDTFLETQVDKGVAINHIASIISLYDGVLKAYFNEKAVNTSKVDIQNKINDNRQADGIMTTMEARLNEIFADAYESFRTYTENYRSELMKIHNIKRSRVAFGMSRPFIAKKVTSTEDYLTMARYLKYSDASYSVLLTSEAPYTFIPNYKDEKYTLANAATESVVIVNPNGTKEMRTVLSMLPTYFKESRNLMNSDVEERVSHIRKMNEYVNTCNIKS